MSVKKDAPAVPENGKEEKKKSDSDSGWGWEDVFCHGSRSLVPEVIDNKRTSFSVLPSPQGRLASSKRKVKTEKTY